jgi:predicted ATPase
MKSGSIQFTGNSQGSETPVLVIFDNVHLMDEASWKLLEIVREYCQRIAFVLLIQTDTNNKIRVHPEAQTYFNENFANNLQSIRIIDLPPLKVEEMNHLIGYLAPKY